MPEIKYKMTAEGSQEVKASINDVTSATSKLTANVAGVNDAFARVSSQLGPAAAGLSSFADKAVSAGSAFTGLATAFGTGGIGAIIGVINFAATAMDAWNKETAEQARLADIAANREKVWLEGTIKLVKEATAQLAQKSVEELRQAAIVDDLNIARISAERAALAAQLQSVKGDAAEMIRVRTEMHDRAVELGQQLQKREDDWGKYRIAQNRALNTEVLVNAREEQEAKDAAAKAEAARFKSAQDAFYSVMNARARAFEKERDKKIALEEEAARGRFKLEMKSNEEYLNAVKDNAAEVAEIKNEQQKTDEIRGASALAKEEARIGRALYAQRIALTAKNAAEEEALEKKKYIVEEDEKLEKLMNMGVSPAEIAATKARDDELAHAKIENRKAVADATIENLQREADAENKKRVTDIGLAQAETARAAAVMTAQPIFNEMLNSEKELLMVNRDTFQDYKNQDWGAIIAAKTQAILAGIAVEATAKTVMESGEALASFGAALGFAAIGDIPSATAAAAAGAQHTASAAVFATIAGGAGAGAIAVGTTRGDGGLFATRDEAGNNMSKKSVAERNARGDGGGGSSGGSISGQGTGNNGETQVTFIMMPGAFLADSRAGVATVNNMVAQGQRDPFMQRQNARQP